MNRCAVFIDDSDRHHYLHLLAEKSRKLEVGIHAYVLMSNHVHLLASSATVGAISRMMRNVGHNYVAKKGVRALFRLAKLAVADSSAKG